jgi:OmpA-OmpF porin, OOP family
VGKGIEPNRIYVDGKGESQPATKLGDCRMRERKALIECLQPDRRVSVEVTGASSGKPAAGGSTR